MPSSEGLYAVTRLTVLIYPRIPCESEDKTRLSLEEKKVDLAHLSCVQRRLLGSWGRWTHEVVSVRGL